MKTHSKNVYKKCNISEKNSLNLVKDRDKRMLKKDNSLRSFNNNTDSMVKFVLEENDTDEKRVVNAVNINSSSTEKELFREDIKNSTGKKTTGSNAQLNDLNETNEIINSSLRGRTLNEKLPSIRINSNNISKCISGVKTDNFQTFGERATSKKLLFSMDLTGGKSRCLDAERINLNEESILKKERLIKEINSKIRDLNLIKTKLELQVKYDSSPNKNITDKKIKNVINEINILKLNLMKNEVDVANIKCLNKQNLNVSFDNVCYHFNTEVTDKKHSDLNDLYYSTLKQNDRFRDYLQKENETLKSINVNLHKNLFNSQSELLNKYLSTLNDSVAKEGYYSVFVKNRYEKEHDEYIKLKVKNTILTQENKRLKKSMENLTEKGNKELLDKMNVLLELNKSRLSYKQNNAKNENLDVEFEKLSELYNQSLITIQNLSGENNQLKADLKKIQDQLTEVSIVNQKEVAEIKAIIKVLQDKNKGYVQFEEELDKLIYDSCMTLKDLETIDRTEKDEETNLNNKQIESKSNAFENNGENYETNDFQFESNSDFSYENKLRLKQILVLNKKLKGLLEDNKKLNAEVQLLEEENNTLKLDLSPFKFSNKTDNSAALDSRFKSVTENINTMENSLDCDCFNVGKVKNEGNQEKINKLNSLVDKIMMQQRDILDS